MKAIKTKKDSSLKISFCDYIPKNFKLAEMICNSIGHKLKTKYEKILSYHLSLSVNGVSLKYLHKNNTQKTWSTLTVHNDGTVEEKAVKHLIAALNLNNSEMTQI